MTQTPPPQYATIAAELPIIPVAQQWALADGEVTLPDGTATKVVYIKFEQPLAAFLAMFDADSWHRLRDAIDQKFTGLEVVRDVLPPTNGHGGLPPGFRP